MTIIRSTAYIGRHGESPKNAEGRSLDELKPGQPHVLYGHTGIGIIKPLMEKLQITPSQIGYGASGRQRAIHSNRAILAGAFDLPVPVTWQEVVQWEPPRFTKSIIDEGLDYLDLKLNAEVVKRHGYPAYAKQWFENPKMREFLGVEITPARDFIRARGQYMQRLVSKLGKDARLIVHTTHTPNMEAMLFAVTGDSMLDSICGLFSSGGTDDGHLLVHVDRYDKSEDLAEVIIQRPGKNKVFSKLVGMKSMEDWGR